MISFYQKYRNTILFNKNLLVSGIISFLVGALFTQIYAQYDENQILNSLITLVIGYAVYIPLFAFHFLHSTFCIPLFAFLFYRDNKSKYIDPLTGKKNSNKIKNDVKKLFTAFSISEAIFIVLKNIHSLFLTCIICRTLSSLFLGRICFMDNILYFNQCRRKSCKIVWKLIMLSEFFLNT